MACKGADRGIETLNLGQLNTNRPSPLLHLKNFLVWCKSSELVYLCILSCCFVGVTPDQSVGPVSTGATSLQGVCSTTSRNSTTNCLFYHGFFCGLFCRWVAKIAQVLLNRQSISLSWKGGFQTPTRPEIMTNDDCLILCWFWLRLTLTLRAVVSGTKEAIFCFVGGHSTLLEEATDVRD